MSLSDTDSDEDLRLLLAPGSSLGGARPKASVRDRDGHLAIAKFPNKADEVNTVLWEAVALTLAAQGGHSGSCMAARNRRRQARALAPPL